MIHIDFKFVFSTVSILLFNLYYFVVKKERFKDYSPEKKLLVVFSWIVGIITFLLIFFSYTPSK